MLTIDNVKKSFGERVGLISALLLNSSYFLDNFLKICKAKRTWSMKDFISKSITSPFSNNFSAFASLHTFSISDFFFFIKFTFFVSRN